MNTVVFILLLILCLILIAIVAYLIYDYFQYKNNVDSSFFIAFDQANLQLQKSNNNIQTQNQIMTRDIVDSRATSNISQYKYALENYFEIGGNKIGLNTNVKLQNGLEINTSNQHELSICNNRDNCIRFSADDDNFNIFPDGVGTTTILAENETPLALFDMTNKSIYLGGNNENNSALHVKNGEVFINQMSARNISQNLDYLETLPEYI
jgi:hypothetical protein